MFTYRSIAAGWGLFVACGCAGILEVQGGVLVSPTGDAAEMGGTFNAHLGLSEQTELPVFGLGGTVKVDVTEVHAVVEQGAHAFLLTEINEDWALYGRFGGAAGVMVTELRQLSITAFSQFGTIYCLTKPRKRCVSAGGQAHYTALFNGEFQHGPWLGVYVGFGSFWVD